MIKNIQNLFSSGDQKQLNTLNTPEKIQSYIDHDIEYDPEREDRTILDVLSDKKAECFNGALFAATCLLYHGQRPYLMLLDAREDEEHVLCVYKQNGKYGSIAQSKYLGLKGHNPMYQSVRDLAVSYMELYFAFAGHYSLTSYSSLLGLSKYKNKWINERKIVEQVSDDLYKQKKHILVNEDDKLFYVSPQRYKNEVLFVPKNTVIPQRYRSVLDKT